MPVKRITIRPAGRTVTEIIPVDRTQVTVTEPDYEVVEDPLSIVPADSVEIERKRDFDYWVERLAPSIAKTIQFRDYTFTPVSVTVEEKVYYRDVLDQTALGPSPRRVKVRRERVTLFGTVSTPPRI